MNKSETAFLKTVRRKRKTPPDPRSESQKRITNKGINARVKKTRVLSLGKNVLPIPRGIGPRRFGHRRPVRTAGRSPGLRIATP